jgi:hypothetical protein
MTDPEALEGTPIPPPLTDDEGVVDEPYEDVTDDDVDDEEEGS